MSSLKRKWKKTGKKIADFPINNKKLLSNYKSTWLAQCSKLKHPIFKKQEIASLDEFLDGLSKRRDLPIPEQFKNIPKDSIFDFNAFMFAKWINYHKLVPDADSATGSAYKVSIADVLAENRKNFTVTEFRIPFKVAVWPTMVGTIRGKTTVNTPIKPGYHWYKVLSDVQLTAKSMVTWFAGYGVSLKGVIADNQELGQKYDIWINIKFTGPAYSKTGLPGKNNSIYVDRVIVIKKTDNSKKLF
jgi:hypothetical protein